MRIGLIDVDNDLKDLSSGKVFPNLPLMKLSAWYKKNGDLVEWYDPLVAPYKDEYDIVYMSKVFSFTEEPTIEINARTVIRGGSGYAINIVDGKEVYDKTLDPNLPEGIEHIYPDYDLYGIKDTAYGFIQRGCPRQCDFCHVKSMQGIKPYKVANLNEFWSGQKKIVLLDPNITAMKEWREVFQELIDSKAFVDFSQGLDIRCMNREKAEMLKKIKLKMVHFAWDRYEDGKYIVPKLREFKEITEWGRSKVSVYILTNFGTTLEQDLERIMFIRSLNFQPYVMRYDKEHISRNHYLNKLARWVNHPAFFWKFKTFEEYLKNEKNTR